MGDKDLSPSASRGDAAVPAGGGNVEPPGEASLPAQSGSTLAWFFLGPNGIRAGWRLLLFILIACLFGFALFRLPRLVGLRPQGGLHPSTLLFGEGMAFLAIFLSAIVMGRIEGRSLADYGLPGRGAFGPEFWRGGLWGFLALTTLLAALRLANSYSIAGLALSGRDIVSYAVLWAAAFLCVGFFEEFLLRGYALYTLATGIGFWPAAMSLSALFGAVHLGNRGENWAGALSAAFIGVFLCFTVRRTGRLWFAVGLHAMWDYSESFIYSVPDSGVMVTGHLLNSSFHGPQWLTGGSVGPEGSALVFAIIAVMFILFAGIHREVRFPVVRQAGVTSI